MSPWEGGKGSEEGEGSEAAGVVKQSGLWSNYPSVIV